MIRRSPAAGGAPLLLTLILWLLAAAVIESSRPAQAAPTATPAHYRTGALITAIHTLNIADGTFDADMWVWTVGADSKRQPIQTMEFVNANKVAGSLDSTTPRGRLFWRQRKVGATFRHHWDLRNYPFDRQTLEIRMEEGTDDITSLVYDPDLANTDYSREVALQGWRITGFRAIGGTTHYNSSFGDPNLAPGSGSDYTRLSLFVSLKRVSYAGYFKLMAAAYAALLLALISFFLNPEVPPVLGARVSLLGGALFAAVISMRSASTTLASDNGLTLVDKVHVAVLLYILAATAVAVISRLHLERGGALAAVQRHSGRVAVLLTLLFAAANALLIAQAAAAG